MLNNVMKLIGRRTEVIMIVTIYNNSGLKIVTISNNNNLKIVTISNNSDVMF